MTAYIAALNRRAAQAHAPVSRPLTLKDRFEQWFASQPAVSKCRRYSMSELEAALGTQGRYIGPVLVQAGWTRRRAYAGVGPYSRYWVPATK